MITETPAFKAWFKNSKVVDSKGLPLICYHGTTKDFTEFRTETNFGPGKVRKSSWVGELGSWFTAPNEGPEYDEHNAQFVAGSFTEDPKGNIGSENEFLPNAHIKPVYLSIQNPFEIFGFEELLEVIQDEGSVIKLRSQLIQKGYDGVVVRDCNTDGFVFRDDWVAFYPQQIKSAFTQKFNPESPSIMESFKSYYGRNKVRDYLRTNHYVAHGVDNLETLRKILETGLRPKTQISNADGQALDSGPYILVYPNKQKIGGELVDYRPGDYLGARVKGQPIQVLFDVDELLDNLPIEQLEARYTKMSDLLNAYVQQHYPTAISDGKIDWTKFGELGGFNDRRYKNFDHQQRYAGNEYFAALENEEYRAKDSGDHFNDLVAVTAPYKIPVKKIEFDDEVNDFVFVRVPTKRL